MRLINIILISLPPPPRVCAPRSDGQHISGETDHISEILQFISHAHVKWVRPIKYNFIVVRIAKPIRRWYTGKYSAYYLKMFNFRLEVVSRWRDPQLQVSEKYSVLLYFSRVLL